jgi:streptomycin 6-kinase
VTERLRDWRVIPEDDLETQDSYLVFGSRDDRPVVLKVIKRQGDEWHSGAILRAFDGIGVVRVCESIEGAVLMDRLRPGHSIAALALQGRDEEATEILGRLIERMTPRHSPAVAVSVRDLASGFDRYLSGGDGRISNGLVERACQAYLELCESQSPPRLLHGDLHHYNILCDEAHGWLAVDPKGLVGEMEYEVGAFLRNPFEAPALFTSTEVVKRRLGQLETLSGLNSTRVLRWAFAQAVLAAIWSVEDGLPVVKEDPCLALAATIQPMISGF